MLVCIPCPSIPHIQIFEMRVTLFKSHTSFWWKGPWRSSSPTFSSKQDKLQSQNKWLGVSSSQVFSISRNGGSTASLSICCSIKLLWQQIHPPFPHNFSFSIVICLFMTCGCCSLSSCCALQREAHITLSLMPLRYLRTEIRTSPNPFFSRVNKSRIRPLKALTDLTKFSQA